MDTQSNRALPNRPIGDVPLPGMYKALTWQLNVTAYPSTKSIRWVSVIREPSDQFEIKRDFRDVHQWGPGAAHTLREHCGTSIFDLSYLGWLARD